LVIFKKHSHLQRKQSIAQYKINTFVSNENIMLVDNSNNLLSKMDKATAIEQALSEEKSLIELATQKMNETIYSVCIIEDYNKFLYQKNKLKKNVKKNIQNKNFQIKAKIDLGDLVRKLEKMRDDIFKSNVNYNINLKKRHGLNPELILPFIEQFCKTYNIAFTINKKTNIFINCLLTKKKT